MHTGLVVSFVERILGEIGVSLRFDEDSRHQDEADEVKHGSRGSGANVSSLVVEGESLKRGELVVLGLIHLEERKTALRTETGFRRRWKGRRRLGRFQTQSMYLGQQ